MANLNSTNRLLVALDRLVDASTVDGNHLVHRWAPTGDSTGPSRTGWGLEFSGELACAMGVDGLNHKSPGRVEEVGARRQLQLGVAPLMP